MPRSWNHVDRLLLISAGVLVGWSTSSWASWVRQQLVQWLWPMGRLTLARPLVTFDIESTGTNVTKDKIVEIAAIKLMPDGSVQVKGPQQINPGIRMSDEVIAIHGITEADLVDCPKFEQVAQEWHDFLDGCDLHGYNAKKFDVPILRNEFNRSGFYNFPPLGVPVVDSFRIFCMNQPRTLGAAVQFYTGCSHAAGAHTALADAQASLKVLVEQVRRYTELPCDVAGLAAMCAAPGRAQDITADGKFQWRGDVPILAFGKYAGEPLAALICMHKDYLRWMSGQDFSDESLIVVQKALKGLLPTRIGGWEPLVFEAPSQQQQQQAQQQEQQRESSNQRGSFNHNSTNNRGRRSSRNSSSRQHQGQQQETAAGISDSSGSSAAAAAAAAAAEQTPVAPGSVGWPTLDSESTSQWADQLGQDSWAAAASPAAAAAPPSTAAPGSASPDGGWSIVDPSTQEMLAGALILDNPEPQHTLEEPEVAQVEQQQQQQQQHVKEGLRQQQGAQQD